VRLIKEPIKWLTEPRESKSCAWACPTCGKAFLSYSKADACKNTP
jgi:hypothetical protein